jgi:hypothetical protein
MPTLPERLLLVYLQDDGRARDTKSTLGHALAEAAVTGLLPGGQLALRDDRLCGASAAPTGDPGGVGWRRPGLRNRRVDHLTASGVLTRAAGGSSAYSRWQGTHRSTRSPTTAPARRSGPSWWTARIPTSPPPP